ncbi:hypothetical protein GCM10027435_22150 [Haloparvum alkalitolerans]|uniref:hypothetical protein n=1 Tax=Haloparvum alkalitolerans TaxID=1042953 RepID=UPI003CF93D2C
MTGPGTSPAGGEDGLDALADAPVATLVARTRAAEARAVVACVDGLVSAGVSPSDVTVVVRDVDAYEAPLRRAARRYEVTLSVWTQLRLKRTIPYRLTRAVVSLLAERERTGGAVGADALLAPLRFEWVPPADEANSGLSDPFPVDSAALGALARRTGEAKHPVAGWSDEVRRIADGTDASGPDADGTPEADAPGSSPQELAGLADALERYAAWVEPASATPGPHDLDALLSPVFEAYRTRVMPARRDADDATLTGTARTARALDRMGELTGELADKYGDWIADGYAPRSWATVADLLDAIATTVPGRREYATARSVDVMEANDVWGLDLPYVVAAGLVDGEWPRPPESAFPAALRRLLGTTDGPGAALRPRAGWTEAGELDQFADTVAAASEGLVCTRFAADADGIDVRPSPYVQAVDGTPVGRDALDRLVGPDRELPEPIVAMVDRTAAPEEGGSDA